MSPRTPPAERQTHAPAWSPQTETREDVKALLLRSTTLQPGEILLFRKIYPAMYDTYVPTLRCVVRARGATPAVEMELVHDALATFWRDTCADGFPRSIQAKLVALAGGLAWNHKDRERHNPATQEMPTSSTEVPGSFPKPERDFDMKEVAHDLFDRLSHEHKAVVAAVILDEDTVAEAARKLGLPRTTVSDRLTAALALLIEMAEQLLTASERTV